MKEKQYQAEEICVEVIKIVEEATIVRKQITHQTTILKTLTIYFGRFLMYLT